MVEIALKALIFGPVIAFVAAFLWFSVTEPPVGGTTGPKCSGHY